MGCGIVTHATLLQQKRVSIEKQIAPVFTPNERRPKKVASVNPVDVGINSAHAEDIEGVDAFFRVRFV